jgi:hypothetical protein
LQPQPFHFDQSRQEFAQTCAPSSGSGSKLPVTIA